MFSESLYRDLLDNVGDGVYFVDLNRKINYWNKTAEQISGYGSESVVGFCCSDNILCHVDENGKSMCLTDCPLAATVKDGVSRNTTAYMLHKNGQRISVHIKVNQLRDAHGNIIGAVEIFRDNSQDITLKGRLANLEHLSLIDNLTGIGNRRFAEITFAAKQAELRRYDWPFGVIFADIDNFKRINDCYGHDVGDQALQSVARSMSESVRILDSVFRWGGDEFLAIISNINNTQLQEIAERVGLMVGASAIVPGQDSIITLSIGTTMAKTQDDFSSVIKRADLLMYSSKAAGKNQISSDSYNASEVVSTVH